MTPSAFGTCWHEKFSTCTNCLTTKSVLSDFFLVMPHRCSPPSRSDSCFYEDLTHAASVLQLHRHPHKVMHLRAFKSASLIQNRSTPLGSIFHIKGDAEAFCESTVGCSQFRAIKFEVIVLLSLQVSPFMNAETPRPQSDGEVAWSRHISTLKMSVRRNQ